MASNNENFYKRLKDLSGIKPVNESKTDTNQRTLVDFERANNGTAYGIVKENHQYFIKKALVKEGDVKVTDFIYIDGVENKNKYQYNSLGEASKQRNFYLNGINEAWDQGGVYFVNETKETENPSMDTNEDFSSLVKRTITEGKKNIAEGREKKFKSTLPENSDEGAGTRKAGLMPEAADVAVKKALGMITEDAPFTEATKDGGAEVTADSEIKDSDILADKKGKEAPQAPINDSNAKAKAEKATGKSKKDANKYPDASDSLAVNQEDTVLKEEASPLVTDDSEIITNDSMVNKVSQKHEAPQAPINDSNAKTEADKAMGTSASEDSAMPNQDKEEQKESDPFDDKEDKGDEKGDIVTEDADKGDPFDDKAKLNTSGDIVAADSDEADADRVDDETKHETPDAEYNNYNQPEKGQKETKGEPSVQKESDPFDDKTKAGQEKGDIVAEAANALGNLLNEGDAKEKEESDPFDDKENAGDEKGDIVAENDDQPFDSKDKAAPKAEKGDIVAEGDVEDAMADVDAKDAAMADMKMDEGDLSTADSEINADSSPANSKGNIEFKTGKTEKGTSYAMNDNAIAESDDQPFDSSDKAKAGAEKGDIVAEGLDEAGEEELDAAADAIGDLDAATDAEAVEEPAMDAEVAVDAEVDADGGEEVAMDAEVDAEVPAEGGEEEVSADGETADLAVKEIEKLVGKVTQKIRTTDLTPENTEGFLKSIVTSFEEKLPEVDVDDRKEVADKILKADEKEMSDGGEEVAVDAEVDDAEVGGGEFDAIEEPAAEVPAEEPAMEPAMEEDAPMNVNGEEVVDGAIPDGDGGTFEAYMESRGYSKDNLEECSASEMGSVVSGYLTDKDGDVSEAEIMDIASYMDDNVATELEEYGHGDFAAKAKPYMKEDGVNFGVIEPTMSPIDMEEDEMDVEDDIEAEMDAEEAPEATVVAVGEPEDEPAEEAPAEMGFAPMADALGGGVMKPDGAPTKSVEVDLNAGTLKMAVSENSKVREYVQNRLAELAGKKKPSINESSKSENLKKLDKLIEQQWKMLGESVKKKV